MKFPIFILELKKMTKRSKYRDCPICGGANPSLYLRATSKPPAVPSQIQVTEKFFGLHGDMVRCANCSFIYIGDLSYVRKVASLYRKMSDTAYVQEEKERRLSFINILKTLEKITGRKTGKILDIGCCTGALLSEAKERGWKPYGIDPSVWACKMAQKMHGLDIINGTLDTYRFPKGNFAAVTLLDVFEHLENPKSVLVKIHKLLKKDGLLCLVTPDFSSTTAKILGIRWWGIRLAHLSYFRWRNLSYLFQVTGFKMVKSKAYIRYFSVYYILVRLFPWIENRQRLKTLLKKITVPLLFFDTFELYLRK